MEEVKAYCGEVYDDQDETSRCRRRGFKNNGAEETILSLGGEKVGITVDRVLRAVRTR